MHPMTHRAARRNHRLVPVLLRTLAVAELVTLIVPLSLTPAQEPAKGGPKKNAALSGRLFVVSTAQKDPLVGLTVVDPNNATWVKITKDSDPLARAAPDGKSVVLNARGKDQPRSLLIFDTLGKKEPIGIFGNGAVPGCWSADGRHIIVSVISIPHQTWRVSADGSTKEKLPIPETEIVWEGSPDGQWLVTGSRRRSDGGPPPPPAMRPLYLMHTDGTGERLLRSADPPKPNAGGGVRATFPRFSPDGRKLLWTETVMGAPGKPPQSGCIVVVDINNSDQRRVLVSGSAGEKIPNAACWSPDGKWIAVSSGQGELKLGEAISRLEVVDLDGKPVRSIDLPELQGPPRMVIDWR